VVHDSNQPSNRWNFAREHDVQLVDEFDQINFDIEPLLAVPPSMLHARHRTLKKQMEDWGFHIRIENGKVLLEGGKRRNTSRARDLARLVSGIVSFLPDLEFSVSDHDRGSGILAADLRQYAHTAVLEKKSSLVFPKASISLTSSTALTEQELEFYEDTKRHHDRRGLVHACSPDSAASNPLVTEEVPSRKSQHKYFGYSDLTLPLALRFMADYNRTTMDFCVSPYLLDIHGSFAHNSAKSSRIVPMFVHCKDSQDSSLLVPALPGWKPFNRDKVISWEERTNPKLFWRGRSTGCHFSRNSDWMRSVSSSCLHTKTPSIEFVHVQQRIRLHFLARATDGEVDLLLQDRPGGKLRRETCSQAVVNEAYLDVGLVGPPVQCEEADGTCDLMEKEISWLQPVGDSYGADYKFQLDVGMYSLLAILNPLTCLRYRREWLVTKVSKTLGYWKVD